MNFFRDESRIEKDAIFNQLFEDLNCALDWQSIYDTIQEDWYAEEYAFYDMCLAWSMCQM